MKQTLINLDPSNYEHPFDNVALEALRATKGFDAVVNFVLNWTAIKWHIVQLCGSNFHVTPQSCPELYQLVQSLADTLDIDRLPKIYTQWSYGINAYTTGYKDDTILVLHTGAVDLMTEPELSFIIGHELGHIKSGHVLYHAMVQYIAQIIASAGLLGTIAEPLKLAFLYWDRMSEFTADRAGLLACQNLDAALSASMKMAGIPKKYFDTTNPRVFLEQAEEFMSQYGDTVNTIIRTISILDDSHPWTVMRAYELVKWVESGEYQAILDNHRGKQCPNCNHFVELNAPICPVCGSKFE